ncbi:helix-turn-helix transcriptional regulator [Kitasatospora brasiliensis]|uniref:helix-turn-helix transcriptional regulator n=1 Tax=Kitasatospora brasiliensis TaxID=3058040 RepID=UPI00293079C4|nr:helix-turn-helix transcriptional regulator [Kitasatospora sp. K002]
MTLSTLETLRLTIAAIRQRTGESQRELAAAVGLTQDKVSRRQSGAQPWSLDEVDTLATHWGMHPLDLLAGPTHAAQTLTWPPHTTTTNTTTPPPAPTTGAEQPPAPHNKQPPTAAALVDIPNTDYDRAPDGQPAAHPAAPCEQCGRPVSHRIDGRPLHLGGWCTPQTAPAAQAATPPQATAPRPAPQPAPTAEFRSEYAGTGRELGFYLDMITSAVEQALEEHSGDTEAASAALEKKAIPNGMELFDKTRVGAVYEHTAYPERLEFLSKKSRNGADEVWEGRHKWENAPLMAQLKAGTLAEVQVDVLDTNAAYCAALKTHLPIGALQHRPDGGWDPKRSGVYLLPARPVWEHPHLPDPIGNRHESGPVLLDEATVRLLIRCHKLGLAEAPHITEAWTSGASEGLLEKFRRVLTTARDNAIHDGDPVTERYVKAIYAKFASTIGESTYNRDIRRPDWMHIIRSQAFANLWYKAHRAHQAGLTIVRLRGTDELHLTGGEWRKIPGRDGGAFAEGRLATQLKLKDQYTLPPNRKRSA